MIKKRIYRTLTILMVWVMVLTFSSCGKKEEVTTESIPVETDYIGTTSRNTIRIDASGGVLEIAVEDYTGIEYKIEEIKAYIQGEVDAYNRKLGVNKINFRQIMNEGNVVKTAISYTDLETYSDFNRMSVKLQNYNAATADRIMAEEAEKTRVEKVTTEHEISAAELAEAGYDPSELTTEQVEEAATEKVVASFTDENGGTVISDKIDANGNMMLITDEKLTFELASGKFLYTNEHAALMDGAVRTDGSGTAIIVLFLGL